MKLTPTGRRKFLRHSALGTGLFLGLPSLARNFFSKPMKKSPEQEGPYRLLFQGDSITDAQRRKEDQRPNVPSALGSGYVGLIAASILGEAATPGIEFYNRGISGNKVFQLADRWEEDCLDLQPDVLSILIGVNDFWHKMKHGYEGTLEIYENDYRALVDRTLSKLPEVELVICEPFMIPGGTAIEAGWPEAFAGYRAAAKRVAKEFNASFIPYQQIFDEALERAGVAYWCPDGVHPGPAGNYLMAQAWMNTFGEE